jgi:lipoprotein signal peptidase
VAADLLSKEWAVLHGRFVVFNHDPAQLARRLLMSFVAIGVALVIARVAAARGLGRQWGVSVGCALLVAGVLSNGVSRLFWDRGVPDFIHFAGGWMNFADFEILCGLIGGALSVVVAAFAAFARERYADGTT